MSDPLPRGIRNNNPGNLRPDPRFKWLGEQTPDGNYCRFDTPEHGIRAAALNLLAYQRKHNLRTIREIITRWAPESDDNDTWAYIVSVAKRMQYPPDSTIDLARATTLVGMCVAIFMHENANVMPYTSAQLLEGVTDALGA